MQNSIIASHSLQPSTPINNKAEHAYPEPESPIITLIKKIWEAVKSFFIGIGDFFKRLFTPKKSPFSLEPNQKELLERSIRPVAKPQSPDSKPKLSYVNALTDPVLENPRKANAPKPSRAGDLAGYENQIDLTRTMLLKMKMEAETHCAPIKDPAMRAFHQTSQKFLEATLECIIDEKITPKVNHIQSGLGPLMDTLKCLAGFAVKFGDPSEKLIFEKLKQHSPDPASDFQHLLGWLLEGGLPNDFAEKLKTAIRAEFLEHEDLIEKYAAPCLKWFSGDHQHSIAEAYENAGLADSSHKERNSKVYESAILILINRKIEEFITASNEKLEGKLPELVRTMILESGKRAGDLLTRRLIAIIQGMDFPKMFNALAHMGLEQTRAIFEVEKSKEIVISKERQLLAQAQQAQVTTPKTDDEKKTQIELKKYIDKVKEESEVKWLQSRGEEAAREAYASHYFCVDRIRKLLTDSKMDPRERQKEQEDLFDVLANQAFDLLLPPQKIMLPNEEEREIDGFLYLCSMIEVPPELREIVREAVEITKKILSPQTHTVIDKIFESFWEIAGEHIQNSILNEMKILVKKAIKIGLKELFDKIVSIENMDAMLEKSLLPQIQEQIIIALTRQSIYAKQKAYAQEFFNKYDPNTRELQKSVKQKLYTEFKDQLKISTNDIEKYEEEAFFKLILPTLDGIKDCITERCKQNEYSIQLVEDSFSDYFKSKPVDSNPVYGELATNLIFKIGKFSSTAELFEGYFKNLISGKVTASIQHIQHSPTYIVEMATKQMEQKCADRTALTATLFGSSPPSQSNDAQNMLQEQIAKTARIAHDFIFINLNQLDWTTRVLVKPAASWVVGTNEKRLVDLITSIYRKTFGNPLMTQNFILRCQETVLNFFSEANKKIHQDHPQQPIRLNKMPTLLPRLY